LNLQSANALLKTLEEPPPGTRLVLTCTDPALLLPTVLSRCQRQRLAEPPPDQAAAWLAGQGVADRADAQVLLAACSGRPLDALALVQAGVSAADWAALPAAVAAGNAGALAGWPLPRALDTLHKLCHDAMACATGAAPRYFPAGRVPAHGQPVLLSAWAKELDRVARNDDHPWHEMLLLEALVRQAAQALAPAPALQRRASSRLATLPAP
jgi:DNA polymerase-3 subunit delta'